MNWLQLLSFKKRRDKRNCKGPYDADVLWGDSGSKHASPQTDAHSHRTSIEVWHEARRSRTSIDYACSAPTTETLSVCQAGTTTLINKTYLCIKHLGTGSSGTVKLALNLRTRKLVAIKAVKKSFLSGGARGLARTAHLLHPRHSTANGHPPWKGWRSLSLRRSRSQAGGASQAAHNASKAANDAAALFKADDLVREIAVLKRLQHNNIVQLLEVIDDPSSDTLLLVMSYVEGATLQPVPVAPSRWQPVPEEVVWKRVRDILAGLDYLHYHGCVHGDIKPSNLIRDSLTGSVKIVDFGSAVLRPGRLASDGVAGSGCLSCTPAFRSPESLQPGYKPSFELDCWALGVCIWMWVYGELPFKGHIPALVYDAIRAHDPTPSPGHTPVSPMLMDLLRGLLAKDPAHRLSVSQAIEHAWVTASGLAPMPHYEDSWTMSDGNASSSCCASSAVARGMSPGTSTSTDTAVTVTGSTIDAACATVNRGGSSGMVVDSAAGHVLLPAAQQQQLHHGNGSSDDAAAQSASNSDASGSRRGLGGKRRHADLLARSVTQEELEAAISYCSEPGGGGAAEAMEAIFTEVAFPARHLIIKSGDPVEKIYLIIAGEVEIFQEVPQPEDGDCGDCDGPLQKLAAMAAYQPLVAGVQPAGQDSGLDRDLLDDELLSYLDPANTAASILTMNSQQQQQHHPATVLPEHGSSNNCHNSCTSHRSTATNSLAVSGTSGASIGSSSDHLQQPPKAPARHPCNTQGAVAVAGHALEYAAGYTPAYGSTTNLLLLGAAPCPAPQQLMERLPTALLHGGGAGTGSTGRDASSTGYMQPGAQIVLATKGPGDSLGCAGLLPRTYLAEPTDVHSHSHKRNHNNDQAGDQHASASGHHHHGPHNHNLQLHQQQRHKQEPQQQQHASHDDRHAQGQQAQGHAWFAQQHQGGDPLVTAPAVAAAAVPAACWTAQVRARTDVRAFVASIESLHALAAANPKVAPLLQELSSQQETDMAVSEAIRCVRLVGEAAKERSRKSFMMATTLHNDNSKNVSRGGSPAPAAAADTAAEQQLPLPPLQQEQPAISQQPCLSAPVFCHTQAPVWTMQALPPQPKQAHEAEVGAPDGNGLHRLNWQGGNGMQFAAGPWQGFQAGAGGASLPQAWTGAANRASGAGPGGTGCVSSRMTWFLQP